MFYDKRCFCFMGFAGSDELRRVLTSIFSAGNGPSPLSLDAGDATLPISVNSSPENMHLIPLFNGGDASLISVNRYAGRVADTLTAYLRANSNESAEENRPATGSTQVIKTCAIVTWPWLILPFVLSLCTVLLLVLTIWRTSQERKDEEWPGLYKSPPLGLLLYGPYDDSTFDQYEGPKELVNAKYAAQKVKTRLRRRNLGKADDVSCVCGAVDEKVPSSIVTADNNS
ncbi:Hypothetical protein D9617_9g025910 [Elsinoe fawcettii]|nr:Hypothetical protein D9617_9g025910 [Elsinoe fawcettii]